ncbi:MAG: CvpA family protein [Clostridia bacterium]|nr:CvpA family protein [Clostridia bacterium]
MTFTIFSLVLILAVALNVSKGAYDGYRTGSTKTIIAFLSVIISLVLGSILSSRVIAPLLSSLITSALYQTELFAFLFEDINRLYVIVAAVISMVLSSIIFVLVFFVLRSICHVIMSIVYKKALEKNGKKEEGSAGENDTWYKRNDKQIGAVVGGITGFLTVLILFSPVIGTLKSVDAVASMITGNNDNSSEQQISADQASADEDVNENEDNSESGGVLDVISDYANDFAGTVMYYCGGKAIYDMNAVAEIDGHTVVLSQEIKSISSIAQELFEVVPSIVNLNGFNSDHVEKLGDICETVDDSYFLSLVTSSIVSSASSSWSRGDEFIGFSRPDFNYSISAFTDSIFSVLATTTPDTVGDDLSTIIRVCGIIMDSGILNTDGDYDAIMEILENSDFLNELIRELEKNPRTEPLIDSLHLFAMNSLMSTIKFEGYDIDEYNGLMEDITEQFNRMNGQPHDKKVETLANYTVEYLQDYGVDVPADVAKVIADAMITNIPNSDGYITTEQMQEFFEQYYQGN